MGLEPRGYTAPVTETDQAPWEADSRLRQMTRWGAGMALMGLRYVTHRVPSYRRNRTPGCELRPPDFDRDLPGEAGTIQRPADGVGPLYHRRYSIKFTDADLGCEAIIERLLRDPNAATPREVSRFELLGDIGDRPLQAGDEMVVRLPGPWNGPVRVIDATASSFRLVTLKGHMEAGEIEFRAEANERGWVVFSIESWARCGDPWFNLLYHRFGLAREMQLHMWSHFCERVVKLAGGIVMSNVELHTCTAPEDGWEPQR
jgi:hypothetical protein